MDNDHKIEVSQDTNSLLIELEFVDGNKITFQVSKIYDHCKSYHESQGGIILVRLRNEFGQSIPVEVCGMEEGGYFGHNDRLC